MYLSLSIYIYICVYIYIGISIYVHNIINKTSRGARLRPAPSTRAYDRRESFLQYHIIYNIMCMYMCIYIYIYIYYTLHYELYESTILYYPVVSASYRPPGLGACEPHMRLSARKSKHKWGRLNISTYI